MALEIFQYVFSTVLLQIYTVTYPEGFSYQDTGTDAQIVALKKGKYTFLYIDILFFRLYFLNLIMLIKAYFEVSKKLMI